MNNDTAGVIPMIAYEDGVAALGWLARASGFMERTRILGRDGRLSHAEMRAGDGLIMLATPTPDYHSPKRHRAECEPARRWSAVSWIIDGVLVYVDDVDAHYSRGQKGGRHDPLRAGGRSAGPPRPLLAAFATGPKTWKAIGGWSCRDLSDRSVQGAGGRTAR